MPEQTNGPSVLNEQESEQHEQHQDNGAIDEDQLINMLIGGDGSGTSSGETGRVGDTQKKKEKQEDDDEEDKIPPIIMPPREKAPDTGKTSFENTTIPAPISNDPNQQIQTQLQQLLSDPLENDKLVAVVRDEKPSMTVLNQIMQEIAEEIAYIKAWRNMHWNGTDDLSDATFKRIKMLRNLVETVIEKDKIRQQKSVGKVDFYGENFQRVLKHFLQVIQKTFEKVSIPPQYEDIFFTQLAKEFDGFEKQAEKIYYGKD